jgi:hypothetical protein
MHVVMPVMMVVVVAMPVVAVMPMMMMVMVMPVMMVIRRRQIGGHRDHGPGCDAHRDRRGEQAFLKHY